MPMKNIITKELSAAQIQLLNAKNISFDCHPVLDFKMEFDKIKAKKLLATKNAIWIFTSIRSVEALNNLLQTANAPQKIFTVGKSAATALEKLRFKTHFIGKVSEELLPILEANSTHPMLYFRGRHYRNSIPDFCAANEYNFQSLECYHSIKLPQDFVVENPTSIWVFSPLSAHVVRDWEGISLDTPIFSIGKTTADYLIKLGFKNVFYPEIPSFKNLVDLFIKQ